MCVGAQAIQELTSDDALEVLRVMCIGEGAGGGLATLCGTWAALNYPMANIVVITFDTPWVSEETPCDELEVMRMMQHSAWAEDSEGECSRAYNSGQAGLRQGAMVCSAWVLLCAWKGMGSLQGSPACTRFSKNGQECMWQHHVSLQRRNNWHSWASVGFHCFVVWCTAAQPAHMSVHLDYT